MASTSTKTLDKQQFFTDKVDAVEKNMQQIYLHMASVCRNVNRLRAKTTRLSTTIDDYAQIETEGLHTALDTFTDTLTEVEAARQLEYDRLRSQVLDKLALFEGECKAARVALKKKDESSKKVAALEEKLEKMKSKDNPDISKMSQLNADIARANADASSNTNALYTSMEDFERKKLSDIKVVLHDYVMTEISFHARALEAFSNIANVGELYNADTEMAELLDIISNKVVSRSKIKTPTAGQSGTKDKDSVPKETTAGAKKKEAPKEEDLISEESDDE